MLPFKAWPVGGSPARPRLHGRGRVAGLLLMAACAGGPGFVATSLAQGNPAPGGAAAAADGVLALRQFSRDVKSAQGSFTQTVTSPDGTRRKTSSGLFEFQRPDRFRFTYRQPFEQWLVGDGRKVWIYDADLQQASSMPWAQALGATPAALLAGGSLEPEFTLASQPAAQGLVWVLATPRQPGGQFQSLRVGFRSGVLAVLEVVDSFGQQSRLEFSGLALNVALPAQTFQFKPPPGVEVVDRP